MSGGVTAPGEPEVTLYLSLAGSIAVALFTVGLAVRKYAVRGVGYEDQEQVEARITHAEERALELDFTNLAAAYPPRLVQPADLPDGPDEYVISSDEMGPPASEYDSYYASASSS